MIPQLILLGLFMLALALNINEHGKISEKPKNAIYSLVRFLIIMSLLVWGGFFDKLFAALL